MTIHGNSGHPDWYVESLSERYQYFVDEMASQKAKRILDLDTIGVGATGTLLAYLAFGNIWAGGLLWVLIVFVRRLEIRHRQYLIAMQMLTVEAEIPHVRETVALPERERP